MNDFVVLAPQNKLELITTIKWFQKTGMPYDHRKLPLHDKDRELISYIEWHTEPTSIISCILDGVSTSTKDNVFNKTLEPEYDVPGDMTPSSIEVELAHEAARPAPRIHPGSTREEIKKKQSSRYRWKFDMKELDEAIREAKIRYSYLHTSYRQIPKYISFKPDLDMINRAMQCLFQDYKILYHLLLKAKSNLPESQGRTVTEQTRPETQPEPEPATAKYNLPRHQARETTPETQNRQEATASDTRQDIMKRMRERRDKQ